jgi:hypothetical protein
MNPAQANSREFLQQAIGAKIQSLEESLRTLKLRRNTLSPVSSLPPEIFAAIFSFLCLPGIPSLGGNPDHNIARLHISHVCHQWREIAFNQPQLWSHVDFNTLSLAGAKEILVRAKSVPLYMEKRVSGKQDDGPFLKEVRVHLPHIRHLKIGAEASDIYEGLSDNLELPAPTLEYFSMFCQGSWKRRTVTDQPFVSDTLFCGSTPRLSCLELSHCNISWNSSLFKGLTSLDIFSPSPNARPELAVWLDMLDEIPQLKALTLYEASPIAPPFPFDVERTVTLLSLTHLNISASLWDCALAIAHLVLPALASLCLEALNCLPNSTEMQEVISYVAQHAHGDQDIQPLQSVLIRNHGIHLELLAWPVPDIDTVVDDPRVLLGVALPTRVKLSFRSRYDARLEIFKTVMAALPLDDLVMLVAQDLDVLERHPRRSRDPIMQEFWVGLLPNWPLLRHMRLAPITSRGFLQTLLEDEGGCENPLLPSLIEFTLVVTDRLDAQLVPLLCDVLMKRVEQKVPLEKLDLRMCPYNDLVAVRLLSEIVVDTLLPINFFGPEVTEESRHAGREILSELVTMWEPLLSDPSTEYDYSEDDDVDD